ncbi:MAG: hypothetical protein K2Y05_03210, partial [Hyphomicrobiaceae bacterium]|nr:hypothetical protein [Hyphomicrobiaceae bacterium]
MAAPLRCAHTAVKRAGGLTVVFVPVIAIAALTATPTFAQSLNGGAPSTRPRATDANRPAVLNRGTVAPAPAADLADVPVAPDIPSPFPADDPAEPQAEPDGVEPPDNIPGQRLIRRDGDLNEPEPQQPRDGIVDIGEPPGPVDGIDPTTVDTRALEEARLFEAPPPPDDPLLFHIEELDPIHD